jgi:hypothetical protein
MNSETPPVIAEVAQEPLPARPVRRRRQAEGRIFRRTGMVQAAGEGLLIYLAGRLLAMVPPEAWPAAIFPGILVLRLVLSFSPPVWAAMRVRSTRREKMSRRFWRLGPIMAGLCALADALVALALGQASLLGGAVGPPDAVRLVSGGTTHLSLGAFVMGELFTAVTLALYFTIAVVCTRLANGGFLRFTMPAGNGRVTL